MAGERSRSLRQLPSGTSFARSANRRDGGAHVSDIQRSRLLAAAVGVIEEHGYTDTTVTRITGRARVSRRTFYELFDNCEECLVAVLESAVAQIAAELDRAGLDDLPWRERVRMGLWAILSFFDREPALARVCVVQSQRAGHSVLERRQEILDRLASILDEASGESIGQAAGLTGQSVVGGVLAILYARLLRTDNEPLNGLLNELMGIVVLPYLGAAAARRELSRAVPAPVLPADRDEPLTATLASIEPLASIPMRLTYRTAIVLQSLAEHPGSSNRQIAGYAGIGDQGQMSKLLTRLECYGLLRNGAKGAPAKGEANQWMLTSNGEQVTRSIVAHTSSSNRGALPSAIEEGTCR